MYSRYQLKIVHLYAKHGISKTFLAEEFYAAMPADPRTIRNAIAALRREKCIYIAAWERSATGWGRAYMRPRYAFGCKPDVAKPQPRHPSEYRKKPELRA